MSRKIIDDNYNELTRKVFKLFLEGKKPAEVVVELGVNPDVVKELYKKFCELNGPAIYSDVVQKFIAAIFNYKIRKDLTFEQFVNELIKATKIVREKSAELTVLADRLERHWKLYEDLFNMIDDLENELRDLKARVNRLEETVNRREESTVLLKFKKIFRRSE